MGLSGLSGTKLDSRSGLDGNSRECGGLSGTEDLCLLIRVSQVRDLYGLPKHFVSIFVQIITAIIKAAFNIIHVMVCRVVIRCSRLSWRA